MTGSPQIFFLVLFFVRGQDVARPSNRSTCYPEDRWGMAEGTP